MSDPFLGMIITVGFNFAPTGWNMCDGSIIPIQQNAALFALLGTTYGGNGQSTFALPDLRGRVPVGSGTGPGLSSYVPGQMSGSEQVTLNIAQMPIHTHITTVSAATVKASVSTPGAGSVLARSIDNAGTATPVIYAPSGTATSAPLGGVNTAAAGGGQPFSTLPPYLALTQIIALQGIFPSRP